MVNRGRERLYAPARLITLRTPARRSRKLSVIGGDKAASSTAMVDAGCEFVFLSVQLEEGESFDVLENLFRRTYVGCLLIPRRSILS